MLTTRKHKSQTRKSREAEMLSDLENMDIMLGSNHFERKDSEFGNSARRLECPNYDALIDNNTNSHTNFGENAIRRFAGKVQDSGEIDSSSEINRLSGERDQRITQEMNGLMNSVSLHVQKTIKEAINEQLLRTTRRMLITVMFLISNIFSWRWFSKSINRTAL